MAGKGSDINEESLRLFAEDPRHPCKYGSKCYQKNPIHHEKYKHPPERESSVEPAEEDEEKKVPSPPKRSKTSEDGKEAEPSGEEEYLTLPDNEKEAIKLAFLLEMPDDFYSFWSFCESLKKDDPSGALKDVGLLLVGPFDIMAGKMKNQKCKKADYLRHWRYYYDPPEFQTVIKGDDKLQFHMGYFRDEPTSLPCFVASNCAAVDGVIKPVAENLFGAVNTHLEEVKSKADPFRKVKINAIIKALHSWADKKSFTLDTNTPAMKTRSRKACAKTFHKAGIVVPINKEMDIGYRPLIETEAQLKKILDCIAKSDPKSLKPMMDKLQPILTAADIANDEGDVGNSLELGLDLFSYGGDMFHTRIEHLLSTAYSILNREEFAEILKTHLQDRRKGTNLSIIADK